MIRAGETNLGNAGNTEKVENEENKRPQFHVFAIGCKGIPAEYGGFESFMENLTRYRIDERIQYHVARMAKDTGRYEYNGATVFNVPVPALGSAKAVYYDLASLRRCIRYCQEHHLDSTHGYSPVFFIMACRIGPFIKHYREQIKALGGKLYVNPDGHEWMRSKWSKPIQVYWKWSERHMVKNADLLICDSKNIEKYIRTEYASFHPQTVYIAYGAEIADENGTDVDAYNRWLGEHRIEAEQYYLMVGRFVPENNFETVLREFMLSKTKRDLVVITTENKKYSNELDKKLGWNRDSRIKFVGSVYDAGLLKQIRLHAFAYIHGHSVGGTNPSLLESLGATKLNLLYDCGFNREVAEEAGLYWTKESKNLSTLINNTDTMSEDMREEFARQAVDRIQESYTWPLIVRQYESVMVN